MAERDTPNDDRLFELERQHESVEAERREHVASAGQRAADMEPFFRRQDAIREEMRRITADTAAGVAAKLRVLNGAAADGGDSPGDGDDTADQLMELLRCANPTTMQ